MDMLVYHNRPLHFIIHTILYTTHLKLLSHSGGGRRSEEGLGHDAGVVVRNLPLTVLPNVNERVPSLDLISGGSHRELVNSGILAPVVSDGDIALENFTLGLLLKEADEVMLFPPRSWKLVRGLRQSIHILPHILQYSFITHLDQISAGAGNVAHCGQKDCVLRITLGDRIGVLGSQRRVPKLE